MIPADTFRHCDTCGFSMLPIGGSCGRCGSALRKYVPPPKN